MGKGQVRGWGGKGRIRVGVREVLGTRMGAI